jgi:hypothetical protein
MRFVSDNRLKASTRRALCALMVLYSAVTAVVPAADALLEAEARASTVHIEDQGLPCSPMHDPLTCPLCQFIALASLIPHVVVTLDLLNLRPLLGQIGEQPPLLTQRFSPLGPRGPPIA